MATRLLLLGLGLILAVGPVAYAQVTVAPPRPFPVPGDTSLPPPPPASLGPAIQPSSPLSFAPVPPPPPPPVLDPGHDGFGPLGSVSANQGWFFDAEIKVVFPQLKYNATNDAPLPITGATLNVPTRSLSTTVVPTLEAGYRLGDSLGYFAASYSFLNSSGSGTVNLGGVDNSVNTSASINTLDLDYGTSPYEFAPRYTMSWRVGARVSDIYFRTNARAGGTFQGASSDFFGAGPHARMDLERRIVVVPGLSLFGRIDGAVLIGQVRQNYRLETGDGMGGTLVDTSNARRSQAVPEYDLQLGLSYAVQSMPGLKFTGGYDLTQIFNAGRLGEASNGTVSNTRGELLTNGFFLRGQYDF